MSIAKEICVGCAALGVDVGDEAAQRMAEFAQLMLEQNERLNLTRIVDPVEVAIKHFVDSLSLLRIEVLDGADSLIDVGTGAGFPGVPLAIACPSLRVVMIDALRKRVVWLQDAAERLGLGSVQVVHQRAEEAGRERRRESFDIAVARAVAATPVVLEYLAPLVRPGGHCVVMKGARGSEEASEAGVAGAKLGLRYEQLDAFCLPKDMGERTLQVWTKVKPTPPAYPRRAGVPKREPLGG